MKNPLTDPDYRLWMLLGQTRRRITKLRQRELHQYNLTARIAAILIIVEASGDSATPTTIARHLLLERHTVSEALKRMETLGLIKRRRSSRQVKISLTKQGLQGYKQSLHMEPIHRLMHSLSSEERQHLWNILLKLRDNASTIIKELYEDEAMSPVLVSDKAFKSG